MSGPGVPPGLGGFGEVVEAELNFNRMVKGMAMLKEISEYVVADQLNIERYVNELTYVVREMFMASGSMFQQEHLRFINVFAATGGGGHGGGVRFPKATMQHKVIQLLRAVNGDKSLFKHASQIYHCVGASQQRT